MGWEPCVVKQRVEILRLWNRLVLLPEDRLTKKVFKWDKVGNYPWSNEVCEILTSVNSQSIFLNNLQCKLQDHKNIMFENYKKSWQRELFHKPKLRTYIQLKESFQTESYVKRYLKRQQRSLCAQLRAGVLPLEVEVGRYKGVPEEERLCSVCDLRVIEDEFHFMFYCPLYFSLRTVLFRAVHNVKPDLFWLPEGEMLNWLFKQETFSVARYVENAWKLRISILYPS